MVLRLKARKSRPPPGPPSRHQARLDTTASQGRRHSAAKVSKDPRPWGNVAGWSSPVARQAHNLKVAGSNPAPATTENREPVLKAPPLNRRGFGVCERSEIARICARSLA